MLGLSQACCSSPLSQQEMLGEQFPEEMMRKLGLSCQAVTKVSNEGGIHRGILDA